MNITSVQNKIQSVLGNLNLSQKARALGFTKRARKISATTLVNAFVTALGSGNTKTLADIHRQYNKLSDDDGETEYKPFHNQIKKKSFFELISSAAKEAISQWAATSLPLVGPLKKFKRVLLHDGSTVKLHDALRDVYPGRFSKNMPAAVELHVTMDLVTGSTPQVVVTPDTTSERKHSIKPESLSGSLGMLDAGYFDLKYMEEIESNDGKFIIRAPKSINPVVEWVGLSNGKSWFPRNKKLKDILHRLPKKQTADMTVSWDGKKYRLMAHWVKDEKKFSFVVTNLYDRKEFPAKVIEYIYRLRWQIELLFKEWKSNSGLRKFNTKDKHIALALIFGSLIAFLLKRLITCCAATKGGVLLSTLKASRSIFGDWPNLFEALVHERKISLYRVLSNIVSFFIKNTKISNPKRDAKKGKLQYGIDQSLFANCQHAIK